MITTRPVSIVPKGYDVARYAMTLANGAQHPGESVGFAERFKDTPQVRSAIELRTKAEVPAPR